MEGRSKNASLVDLHSGMIPVGRADSSFRMCMHYADACAVVSARRVCVQHQRSSIQLRSNGRCRSGEKMFEYVYLIVKTSGELTYTRTMSPSQNYSLVDNKNISSGVKARHK